MSGLEQNNVDMVFVGACTMDTIAAVQGYPEPDSRTVAADLLRSGGGPAATAAVAAARLGGRPALVTAVGDDADGREILEDLRAEGVDVEATQMVTGARSGASVITVDLSGGTRAIINRPPPPIDFAASGLRDLIVEAAWVHADHVGLAAFSTEHWPASTALRSFDGGNPSTDLELHQLDLYVPTLEQLRQVARSAGEPTELARAAQVAGAGRVVVTDGPNGAYALDSGSDAVVHIPAARGNAHSTLGAGDVFHGALVASLSAGADFLTAVAIANTVALGSCTGLDGRSTIPGINPHTTTIDDLDLQGAISWH